MILLYLLLLVYDFLLEGGGQGGTAPLSKQLLPSRKRCCPPKFYKTMERTIQTIGYFF